MARATYNAEGEAVKEEEAKRNKDDTFELVDEFVVQPVAEAVIENQRINNRDTNTSANLPQAPVMHRGGEATTTTATSGDAICTNGGNDVLGGHAAGDAAGTIGGNDATDVDCCDVDCDCGCSIM